MLPPHGIGMDIAQIIDIGNIDTRCVPAPALQYFLDLAGCCGVMFVNPEFQENPVGIVVARHVVARDACFDICFAAGKHHQQRFAGHIIKCVILAVVITATGIVQMREIELVDLFLFHKVQKTGKVLIIFAGHGETNANRQSGTTAQFCPAKGKIKTAFKTAKIIMCCAKSIQTDPDIVIVGGGNLIDVSIINQGPVARQCDIETKFFGIGRNIKNIGPHKRFPTRQDQHRNIEITQIFHGMENLFCR